MNGFSDGVVIKGPVLLQLHLTVGDPVFCQGTSGRADPDNFLQCIIRLSSRGKKFVAGPEIAEKRNGQSVGSAGNLRAHQTCLRVKGICVNLFQSIAAEIIVPVTGRAVEAFRADFVLLHGEENFHLIVFCGFIKLFKPVFQKMFDRRPEFIYFRGNSQLFIYFFHD